MKKIINILNKEIQDTRDLIFETENKIQSEEFKKESAETKINIDALRSLKKPMNMIIINYLMLNT